MIVVPSKTMLSGAENARALARMQWAYGAGAVESQLEFDRRG